MVSVLTALLVTVRTSLRRRTTLRLEIPALRHQLQALDRSASRRVRLVPSRSVVSLGSAIFEFLAAGTFRTVQEAQHAICPSHNVHELDPAARAVHDGIYPLYRKLYFDFGQPGTGMGDILPSLIQMTSRRGL